MGPSARDIQAGSGVDRKLKKRAPREPAMSAMTEGCIYSMGSGRALVLVHESPRRSRRLNVNGCASVHVKGGCLSDGLLHNGVR